MKLDVHEWFVAFMNSLDPDEREELEIELALDYDPPDGEQ